MNNEERPQFRDLISMKSRSYANTIHHPSTPWMEFGYTRYSISHLGRGGKGSDAGDESERQGKLHGWIGGWIKGYSDEKYECNDEVRRAVSEPTLRYGGSGFER